MSEILEPQEETALIVVERLNLPALFAGEGLEALLARTEAAARQHVPDATTPQGRKDIKALAYKVARSKTALDEAGKEMVADIKRQAVAIDKHRKIARDRLDALRDEIRAPADEWDRAEAQRVEKHQKAIGLFSDTAARETNDDGNAATSADLRAFIDYLQSEYDVADWEEFREEAEQSLADAIAKLARRADDMEKREAEQAELARLRKEAAAREAQERDERIKREAVDQAQREAEAKAREERQAAERREAELRLDAERAEQRRVAEIQALKDEAARKEAEAEAQKKKDADDQARREADVEHRRAINAAALDALVERGIPRETALACIKHIVAGHIPNVTIRY